MQTTVAGKPSAVFEPLNSLRPMQGGKDFQSRRWLPTRQTLCVQNCRQCPLSLAKFEPRMLLPLRRLLRPTTPLSCCLHTVLSQLRNTGCQRVHMPYGRLSHMPYAIVSVVSVCLGWLGHRSTSVDMFNLGFGLGFGLKFGLKFISRVQSEMWSWGRSSGVSLGCSLGFSLWVRSLGSFSEFGLGLSLGFLG